MASRGNNILRGHNSEPGADYEKSLPDAALTVGSISRALGDAKTTLAETRRLSEDVDDLDELIASIEKSAAENRATIKAIDAGTKATADEMAKLRASLDTPGMLAKLAGWEESHIERLHKQYGHGTTLEYFKAQMAADSELFRKRDAFDDGVDDMSPARFNAMYRVVK